jgi:hypothetical protein
MEVFFRCLVYFEWVELMNRGVHSIQGALIWVIHFVHRARATLVWWHLSNWSAWCSNCLVTSRVVDSGVNWIIAFSPIASNLLKLESSALPYTFEFRSKGRGDWSLLLAPASWWINRPIRLHGLVVELLSLNNSWIEVSLRLKLFIVVRALGHVLRNLLWVELNLHFALLLFLESWDDIFMMLIATTYSCCDF